MIVLGLTGSIGMGKSAVTAMFRAQGVPVFDADAEVHHLQGPGGALVSAIEARFPGTTGTRGVDRQKLGALVLGQPQDLRALEGLIHPAVYKARQMFLRRNRSRALVVLDIPLLFEKKGRAKLDAIVTVSAPLWMQRKRVLARANMTPAKFKRIKALQLPDHHKRARADFVIETGCQRFETRQAVRRLIACLTRKKGG
ncbi:MAG: dephospho-CoA kinase [Chakrabartia sp.]